MPDAKKVVWASVNCEQERSVCELARVNKYPTMKLFEKGKMRGKEFRGARSVQSLTSYIKQETGIYIYVDIYVHIHT